MSPRSDVKLEANLGDDQELSVLSTAFQTHTYISSQQQLGKCIQGTKVRVVTSTSQAIVALPTDICSLVPISNKWVNRVSWKNSQ